jgi:hypothetical protein
MRQPVAPQRMKRLLSSAVTFLVVAAGVVVATGSPAHAAAWNCPSHNSAGVPIVGCIYPNVNGVGAPYLAGFNQGCHNLTGGWNDIASSIRNNPNHGHLLRIWKHANCSGVSYGVVPGGQGNLGAGGGTVYPFPNDQASSWAVYPPGSW